MTISYDALDLTIQGPLELIRPYCTGTSPDMFKPVYYEECIASKRVFKTLLECFLVAFVFA